MGKRQKNQKTKPVNPKKSKFKKNEDVDVNDLNDDVDTFHKKRDMIPLDINEDSGDSEDDADDDLPVFDYKGINGDEDDEDDDDDEEEEDYEDKGLAAKIVRQQKYLREKTGGIDDEFLDEDEEEDEKRTTAWSTAKKPFYGSDEDFELRSGEDDSAAEEEEEVKRMQKERAQSLRAEDFGLESDEDDSDDEPTMEEMIVKDRTMSGDKKSKGDAVPTYEKVKKDFNLLSRDEQMDAVYSSAPELVGLLAELNDAYNQLETQVKPLLDKVIKTENSKKEGMHYLEVKQCLLVTYCQAIVFYLLLKSEGQPVRDHPVIARLVEIKTWLDKMKELDRHIPDELEDMLNEKSDVASAHRPAAEHATSTSDLCAELNQLTGQSAEELDGSKFEETAEPFNLQTAEVDKKKRKRQDKLVSSEGVKMLQYRAALEEKLKLKKISGSDTTKAEKIKKQTSKRVTGKLETTNDFDDEATELEGTTRNNGRASTLSSKLSSIIPVKNKKGVSGDDDLPERDDLGERRLKHQRRVLARAGIEMNDEPENGLELLGDSADDVGFQEESNESEDDLYKSAKRQRDEKLKMKAEKYSRVPQYQYDEPDTATDGKRHITTQMEKNRGLTRIRKKQNPRVKNKNKAAKAVKNRKGQVREIRKPTGPYGGETTGINARVSRSIRFKG